MNDDDLKKEIMKNEKKLKIGWAIENILKSQGISLRQLALKSGIPYSSLCHLKNNRPPRNLEHINKLSNYLQVSIHYLLYGYNDPHYQPENPIGNSEGIEGVYEISIKKIRKKEIL